jgi:hypothetical protein
MRLAKWLAASAFLLAPAGISACSEEADDSQVQNTDPPSQTGGTGNVVTVGGRTGSSGDTGNPSSECDEFAGLTDCGGMTLGAELKTVNLLLVIDKSGSMTDEPEGFDANKWDALVQALDEVLNEAAPILNLGLVLYPYSRQIAIPEKSCGTNCCLLEVGEAAVNVPIAPGTESVGKILSLLESTPPGGGTPTADALRRAREYLTAATLEGDTYVVLATDGGPNCNFDLECDADRCTANLDNQCSLENCCDGNGEYCVDDESVTGEIEALRDAGIPTFVVGIPGTEDYAQYLDDFAEAGGVPNPDDPPSYYAVDASGGVEGLTGVFRDITEQLVRSCEVELEREPPAPSLVNVAVDCTPIRPEEDDGSGWELDTSASPALIRLSGPVCEEIQTSGAKRVDVVYGCKTIQ